jgi:peptidyl-prolyl cis-trans isomerase B (cyclophilin B)
MKYTTPLLVLAMLLGVTGCNFIVRNPNPADRPVPEDPAAVPQLPEETVTVRIATSEGDITLDLWPEKSPDTVENFLVYVDEGFYDGTIFHRVIPGFMIQGGGFTPRLQKKPTHAPIRNEARSDVQNERGTIAMARTPEPHSATAQFFINHANNYALDHVSPTERGYGYCVFGKVTDGMDVVDAIARVQTATINGMGDVPVEPVLIESIRRVD